MRGICKRVLVSIKRERKQKESVRQRVLWQADQSTCATSPLPIALLVIGPTRLRTDSSSRICIWVDEEVTERAGTRDVHRNHRFELSSIEIVLNVI